jgi:hypothetical protein
MSSLKSWDAAQVSFEKLAPKGTNFQSFICSNTSAAALYSMCIQVLMVFQRSLLLGELTKNQPLWGRFSSSNVVHTSGIMTTGAAGCTHGRDERWDLCRTECTASAGNGTIFVRSPPYTCLYRQATVCCRSMYCVTARSSRPFAVDVVRDGPACSISCAVVHIISKSTKEKMESVYTFPIGHSYIV